MVNMTVKIYTISTETLIGCTHRIGSKIICLKYSVFVLSKFIMFFHLHCLFCLVHYSLYLCLFVICYSDHGALNLIRRRLQDT
jgi:hypothetical protein